MRGNDNNFSSYDRSVLLCDDEDDDDDMEEINNYGKTLSSLSDDSADRTSNKTPTQKPKRGRKMTMTTKDNDAMCTTIVESTTILNDSAAQQLAAINAKKKKRGRKNVSNQSPREEREEPNSKDEARNVATTSASDEDEECSAKGCIRPTGNNSISFFPFFMFYASFNLNCIFCN